MPARGRALLALALLLPALPALVLLLPALPAGAHGIGRVEGRVRIAVEGASAFGVGPIVVYLEPLEAIPHPRRPAVREPQLRQRDAQFTPGFLVVAAGQEVSMPNEDRIFHNVFSYSRGNRFDLGLYAGGESRSVTFDQPGVVKIYCSIHESMSASVYVAPSGLFAQVSDAGLFSLADVPEGRYRLRTWCERLPETQQEIRVQAGRTLELEIAIGAPAP
jgi:hypothetical protein